MQKNKKNKGTNNNGRRILPFVVEFVKFSAAFCAIIAVALFTLRVASAMQ